MQLYGAGNSRISKAATAFLVGHIVGTSRELQLCRWGLRVSKLKSLLLDAGAYYPQETGRVAF